MSRVADVFRGRIKSLASGHKLALPVEVTIQWCDGSFSPTYEQEESICDILSKYKDVVETSRLGYVVFKFEPKDYQQLYKKVERAVELVERAVSRKFKVTYKVPRLQGAR